MVIKQLVMHHVSVSVLGSCTYCIAYTRYAVSECMHFLSTLFCRWLTLRSHGGSGLASESASSSVWSPLCTMAFYSYVMMNSVRVGIKATIHTVREQRDTIEPHLASCSTETNIWLDKCNCLWSVSL